MTIGSVEFAALFRNTLSDAQIADGGPVIVDESSMIELHLKGIHRLTIEETTNHLFLSEDRYFKVIDVSVHPRGNGQFKFFVRPSGHAPGSWETTWSPETTGPFKVMTPA